MILGYKKGEHLACCDRCGELYYGSQLRADGLRPTLLVCKRCWWRRHPNEEPIIPPLELPVPNPRHFRDSDDDDPITYDDLRNM